MTQRRKTPKTSRAVWALLCVCLSACDLPAPLDTPDLPPTQQAELPAIYGVDDRFDVYAHPDVAWRTLAQQSVAALIYPGYLNESNPDNIIPLGPNLQNYKDLCSSERFLDQVTSASCSGTLIDDDLLLTAGHCVDDIDDCLSLRFVFHYYYEAPGLLSAITSQDVFRCKRLVARENSGASDFAIVQLDRPATPRFTPAPVDTLVAPRAVDEPLGVIGFCNGIPAKIDTGGHVIDPRASTLVDFVATTDTFSGNSGSGVFDMSLQLVGILVAGATDYTMTSNNCQVATTYPEDGGNEGETIVYAHHAISALCALGWPSERLCPGAPVLPWCEACVTSADCLSGWSCRNWTANPDVTWCGRPCTSNQDCLGDHYCSSAGYCSPEWVNGCADPQTVWDQDICGRLVALDHVCSSSLTCQDGECEGTCQNDCSVNQSQCVSERQAQACIANVDGCLQWGPATTCDSTEACVETDCEPACATAHECSPLQRQCSGSVRFQDCVLNSTTNCRYWSPTERCPTGEICVSDGQCISQTEGWCATCTTNADCPLDWSCAPHPSGVSLCARTCASDADCRGDFTCTTDGLCAPIPSAPTCADTTQIETLDACGLVVASETCPENTACDAGICISTCVSECTLNEVRCSVDNTQIEQCIDPGNGCTQWESTDCSNTEICSLGACIPLCTPKCTAGESRCSADTTQAETCIDPGNGCTQWESTTCAVTETCDAGQCKSLCDNCELNERRCPGWHSKTVEQCIDEPINGVSCLRWSVVQSCDFEPDSYNWIHVCEDGQCITIETCFERCMSNPPPPAECLDDRRVSLYKCIQVPDEKCPQDIFSTITCEPSTHCEDGVCVPDSSDISADTGPLPVADVSSVANTNEPDDCSCQVRAARDPKRPWKSHAVALLGFCALAVFVRRASRTKNQKH